MSYFDDTHKKLIERIEVLWKSLHDLEDFAHEYGIEDIFQDNGAKILQQLVYLDMKALPGREGNDAVSNNGIEWEMKSINLETSASGFSTNHHVNHVIIAKYRKVPWTFAFYKGIKLEEIYVLTPEQLEPIYKHWEKGLETKETLNNPKIPVSYVRDNGVKVFPINPTNPIDPESVALKKLS